jgi:hypothetical protein
MLIPVGVAVLLGVPTWDTLAFGMMVAGFISFVAGWAYTIRDERRDDDKEKEARKQTKVDEQRKKREHYENLIVFRAMAKQLGVSTVRLDRLMRRWLEQEGLLDEWGNESKDE